MSCLEESDIAFEDKISKSGNSDRVTYRSDYPSHLKGKTILVQPHLNFGRREERLLKGALKKLGVLDVEFTTLSSYPHDAEIQFRLINRDDCGGRAHSSFNGLYTTIDIDPTALTLSDHWVRSLFMHEIAHCLGLGHPNQQNRLSRYDYQGAIGVMSGANCSYAQNGTFTDVWDQGEILTLSFLY